MTEYLDVFKHVSQAHAFEVLPLDPFPFQELKEAHCNGIAVAGPAIYAAGEPQKAQSPAMLQAPA